MKQGNHTPQLTHWLFWPSFLTSQGQKAQIGYINEDENPKAKKPTWVTSKKMKTLTLDGR